ncbi:MAG: hypothetical protein G8D90_04355 [gamma proteobacterium symbiont of Clathrolucina costata]|nr:hypothetical protein [Candidatus Thiodiazotropha endolucinida]
MNDEIMASIKYEAWVDDESVTFATSEAIEYQKAKGLLGNNLKLLHVVEADTPEEAMAVHHIKMGWEPYKPMGEPQLCPNDCGSYFYPEGSGVCPNCGKIS